MANPALLQTRVGFGTQLTGPTGSWHDFRVSAETLGIELPTIEDPSIVPGGYQPEGLETKIAPGGALSVAHGPEEHVRFLAELQGFSATPVESPTGVFLHRLSPAESDIAFDPLIVEVSRDMGQPEVHRAHHVSQLTMQASPRSVLTGEITLVGPRWDTWEAATQLAATATPTPPRLRGYHGYSDLIAADGNIFVRVDSFSSPNVTIETKIGAAAAYSNTQVVPVDAWTNLEDEAGVLIGDDGVPVQIYLSGSYTAADEWRIDRERAVWTPSLPTASPLNEIAAEIYVDGTIFRTREISLTLTRGWQPDEVISGRFTDEFLELGFRTVAGSLNRRAVDKSLINRLLRARTFAVRLVARGAYIGATGVRSKIEAIMMNCKPSGRTPSVSNQTTFDEPFNFIAHESSDATYPAPITFDVINSIEDLTA